MIRDITIGQYYPVDSPIHRLDPRTKLIGTLTFIISLFLFKSIAGYLVATAFLVTVIRLSKVPFKFMVRGLKAILLILIIAMLFNVLLANVSGDRVLGYDLDDYAQRPDRRAGERAGPFEENSYSRA